MTVIAIANQKGGVAKTTTAVTLAHGLALRFKRVLLIDLDPQGNCADSLGVASGGDLYDWLIKGRAAIYPARVGLDLLRSDATTANLKRELSANDFGAFALRDALEQHGYDVVILDCAPSLDILHVSALMAADRLIIPTKLDQFSSKGIAEILTSLLQLHRRGCRCQLEAVLPTFYDRQTNETQMQLESLAGAPFAAQLYRPIPVDTRIRKANRLGKTLWEFAPETRALVDGYIPALERLMGAL